MKLKHIAIAAAAALTLAGCSTAAEQACLNNQPMAGYTALSELGHSAILGKIAKFCCG